MTVRTMASLLLSASAGIGIANAQTLGPDFIAHYSVINVGTVPGVPASYGGLAVNPDTTNELLIGGAANSTIADIYRIRFTRDSNQHLIGFECGNAVFRADAFGVSGGIDGGLAVGPGGVLFYTTYNDNRLGQIKPGSTTPDRMINLTDLGVLPSTGTLAFVPDGFPGAGRLKIASYSQGRWYDTSVTPDGSGTFNVAPVTGAGIQISGGPEGIAFVAAGNPGFANDSVLISEYSLNTIAAYRIDANGDPIPTSRRVFLSGLSGAEGAAIDPVSGDFLFSTFGGGGGRVVRVTGFTTTNPPGDMNCDGVVSVTDIAGFVMALTNPAGYAASFPNCDIMNADLNASGTVSVSDIAGFVGLLTGGIGCEG